jgi:hypothetical protein
VTQGFEPRKETAIFPTLEYARAWLLAQVGAWDDWRRLELGPEVPAEGWWISWGDECLAPAPGG